MSEANVRLLIMSVVVLIVVVLETAGMWLHFPPAAHVIVDGLALASGLTTLELRIRAGAPSKAP